jgi:hypothetical protein
LSLLSRWATRVQWQKYGSNNTFDSAAGLLHNATSLLLSRLRVWTSSQSIMIQTQCSFLPASVSFLGSVCHVLVDVGLRVAAWEAACSALDLCGSSFIQFSILQSSGGLLPLPPTSSRLSWPEAAMVPGTRWLVDELASGVGLMMTSFLGDNQRCSWLLSCYLAAFDLSGPGPGLGIYMAPGLLGNACNLSLPSSELHFGHEYPVYTVVSQATMPLCKILAEAAVMAALEEQQQQQ